VHALPAGAQTMKPGLWEINNKSSGGRGEEAMAEMQKQMAESHMTVSTTDQGRTDTMVMDASGKWLQADCGNVKPVPGAK
jgi:hypothetical protein